MNNCRSYYSMTAFTWRDAVTSGETGVLYWPFHILELRAAMEAIVNWVNG
jgi:hypothetical protein